MNFEPQDKPGYTLLHAQASERLYVIQKKNGMGAWRLFLRKRAGLPLRTIFVGDSLTECTQWAEDYEAAST